MLRRRPFLSGLALAPIAANLIPGRAAAQSPHRADQTAAAGVPRVSPERATPVTLAQGLELAGGFTVVRACGLHYGALPFVLEGEGVRFQVDVLRRGEGPSGVFDTEHFSLFVRDHGSLATRASHERGARALGAALERKLSELGAAPELATFAERAATYPAAAYAVDFVPDHSR